MNTKCDPMDLAERLLDRSVCHVAVACVIADAKGILAWGWNSSGPTGHGIHAEAHALLRANRRRLAGATLYVCARRGRRRVTARPCASCQPLVKDCHTVIWRDKAGMWVDDGLGYAE